MHLHEFQAKEVLKTYGIPIPEYVVVSSVEEARNAMDNLGWDEGVVKVQVHAGGRGKAGGVKIGKSKDEVLRYVEQLLGMKIVNSQTGPEGMIANQVMISPPIEIAKEYYLGVILDRNQGRIVLIGSPEGGMDIEEVAEKYPDRWISIAVSNQGTIRSYHLIQLAKVMGWNWKRSEPCIKMVEGIAEAFVESDAMMLEINPLVQTKKGDFLALDAKLTLDDNALYRLPKLSQYYDPTQLSTFEREAKKYDLAYVAMDGNIGCMVNGAGLAMATMDIIQHYGGKPANFLDVGGGADTEKVAAGFRIIVSDPKVKAVLVNIFGGIMNCKTIAEGIVAVVSKQNIKIPLIVRMEGTNVEEGRKIIADAQLKIILAKDLEDAAKKAVQGVIK